MKQFIVLACALLLSSTVATHAQTTEPLGYGPALSLDSALELVENARSESLARGLRMAIAVVEPSGELVAFARMDDVPYASIRIAQQKARTAARFRIPTSAFEDRVRSGDTKLLSSDEVIAVGGGVPIIANGRVIGALGISGGTAAEDTALATAIVGHR